MKLLTKSLLKKFETIGSQESNKDPLIIAKFFCPWNNRTRYATEYDPHESIFFGIVEGHEVERGYFSLYELTAAKGPFGLSIERDRYFTPCTLSNLNSLSPCYLQKG